MRKNTIVLDFDGVICDGLGECLLSAWNSWHALGVEAFSEAALDNIPPDFARRFAGFRNFVRHPGHFIMPFIASEQMFENAHHFEEAFRNLPAARVGAFLANFEHYRSEVIRHRYQAWIGLHAYYDGLTDVLRNRGNEIHIVSGKDTHSIIQILRSQDLSLPAARIHGGQTSKMAVLERIAAAIPAGREKLLFCDDNLPNVLEASQRGIDVAWAGWGYHTRSDLEAASRCGLAPVALRDFVSAYS